MLYGQTERLPLFETGLVRYGEFLAALCTTGSENFAAVYGRHPLTETVFVYPLAARGLESPFHFSLYLFYFFIAYYLRSANVNHFYDLQKNCGKIIYETLKTLTTVSFHRVILQDKLSFWSQKTPPRSTSICRIL